MGATAATTSASDSIAGGPALEVTTWTPSPESIARRIWPVIRSELFGLITRMGAMVVSSSSRLPDYAARPQQRVGMMASNGRENA
jgi:hypothetical protein